MSDNEYHICERLERLRVEMFGHRGKSEMARRLGIRPSTYDRYERDRIPPADLLVKVGQVSDVTLGMASDRGWSEATRQSCRP